MPITTQAFGKLTAGAADVRAFAVPHTAVETGSTHNRKKLVDVL
ncbi:MAG TPA: hypothetical protein V6C97_08185 [Oculatellaceae cyanobacterium]